MKQHPTPNLAAPRAFRLLGLAASSSLLLCGALLRAAVPAGPIVELTFPEGPSGAGGNGVTTTNTGTLAGYFTFAQDLSNPWETNALPAFTNVVPTGTFVPAGNSFSVDMGPIGGASAAGNGGRAVDSAPSLSTIGECDKLTICGWINANSPPSARTLNLAYAFESAGISGFCLVEDVGSSTLGLYINGTENAPPFSTVKVTTSPSYANINWIFFAVTYDPTLPDTQLKYYFGRPDKLAALDVAGTYVPASALGTNVDYTGPLSVGNSSSVDPYRNDYGSISREFKGLMDEFRIYTNALTLDQVQQAQLNASVPSTPCYFITQPAPVTAQVGANAVFTSEATGSGLVTYQWRTNGVAVAGQTNASFTITNVGFANNSETVSVKIVNAALPAGLVSSGAKLTVIPADPKMVSLSFSFNADILTLNNGSISGTARRRTPDASGTPMIASTNVPSGPYAPSAAYNIESLYYGPAGASARAVDMTNNLISSVGNLGSLNALTICGWLNSANYSFRTTSTGRGNAIVNANSGNSSHGFVLAYRSSDLSATFGQNGRLLLQVNEWTTGTPTSLSSPNSIPLDVTMAPTNWIFFAVTYDGTLTANNLNYYLGSPTSPAGLDSTSPLTYNKGVITETGPLAIGQHNCLPGDPNTAMTGNPTGRAAGGDNGGAWRGLMDEIKIYSKVLSLAEIQAAQTSPSLPPHMLWNTQTNNLVLSWEGPYQLQSRVDLDSGSWANVTTPTNVSGTIRSIGLPIAGPSKYYRLLY